MTLFFKFNSLFGLYFYIRIKRKIQIEIFIIYEFKNEYRQLSTYLDKYIFGLYIMLNNNFILHHIKGFANIKIKLHNNAKNRRFDIKYIIYSLIKINCG
jgi:hypothetical protein